MSSEGINAIINRLRGHINFLMVGTIEARKAHEAVLGAFELLWKTGVDVNLVIVGKRGWMVEDLAKRLITHHQRNKHLFWLEGLSDEHLEDVYAAGTCLIAASYGEGFGLPLIEAARHKLPILARDIPVFREIAGNHAHYFENTRDIEVLFSAFTDWLNLYKRNQHPRSDGMPWVSWKESSKHLLGKILPAIAEGN
ncbi:MAG TPA: glycosyltransferase [Syntrophorhabdaceae bacterium]|nr:glycosyltransferase [Syntrophorhabdaceae bacterium]